MTGLYEVSTSVTGLPQKAASALLDELRLTPKPGLVDCDNSGAHRDMDYPLFLRSIAAITPWFTVFETLGFANARLPPEQQLALLRPAGLACEKAMFAATGQVNTHQGGIFSLGLLCCAAGRLAGRDQHIDCTALCVETGAMCQGIVARELAPLPDNAPLSTRLYHQFALTGARGEAESGFLTVRRFVLPYWHQEAGERQRHSALLRLMAVNQDTNLVSRGGMEGLKFVQNYALELLNKPWEMADIYEMDRRLTARNLSPGGSADLLAVAAVLADYLSPHHSR